MFDQGLFVRQAGGGEGGNGIRQIRERKVCVSDPPQPHVRVHDQLYTQTQAPPREVHDEQRVRKLHDITSEYLR